MKLAFWKKDDDKDLDDAGDDPFEEPMKNDPFNSPHHPDISQNPSMNQPPVDQGQNQFDMNRPFQIGKASGPQNPANEGSHVNLEMLTKDIEIISTKIDSLKSEIESMNQRLMVIESIARKEQNHEQSPKRYW